ncbi:MAG: hypothetical protein OEM96_01675 [Gemmatimonadota bacterium]|nr:hypothetical protein [Gemmatimonadota bacterium]
MASEIRRVRDDKVVAVGANAIRDGDRYLVTILLPATGQPLSEADLGAVFEVRDTALFFSHAAQLELTGLPDGTRDMAEFRLLESARGDGTTMPAA